jgi:hypothetical protein
MASDFIDKMKGFLFSPVETFQASRSEELGEAVRYYVILLAVYSILSGILIGIGLSALSSIPGIGGAVVPVGGLFLIIITFIAGLIGIFIAGIILHIFVYLVGGRNGLEQTLKAVMYASTPSLLLGWIPLIGIIAGIWAIVLEVLGIRELHNISTGRAVLAVLLPIVIIVFLVFLAVFLGFFLLGITPGGGF